MLSDCYYRCYRRINGLYITNNSVTNFYRAGNMNHKKFVAAVLTLLLAVVNATSSSSDLPGVRWDPNLTANVNEYVDKTIDKLIPFMINNGLEPMELPDVEEGFEVRPIWITYSARLKIHDGSMTGITNVVRSGDQIVKYLAKMLRVRVQLQFNDLEFNYKYLVKVMNLGPTGGIVGSLSRFVVTTDVLIDFNNDEIHLQQFTLSDIGRLRVRLTGNILFDWLLNPVIRTFTLIFDNVIMNVVETNIRSTLQDAIDGINDHIRDLVTSIENHI